MCAETTKLGVDSPPLFFPKMNPRYEPPKIFLGGHTNRKQFLAK